jgi:predicted O-linked N-acetylglucosamine transferase (SPINDLY family)
MSRVPRSYLWLLKPSRSRGKDDTFDTVKYNALVESNLRTAAAAAGVHPNRIIFAERENKSKHILRY